MAQAGITKRDLVVGGIVAVAVHALLGVAMAFAPAGNTGAPPPEKQEKEGCAGVVSPSCVVAGAHKKKPPALPKRDEPQVTEDRRCPEPARRLLRRDEEQPPPVSVDLLQAQLVAALGDENAKPRADVGSHAGTGGQHVDKPVEKLEKAIGTESKLGQILDEDKGGDARKKKLGAILGIAGGAKDGEGKVNMTGTAYIRVVKQSIQAHFEAPAHIPPWELAGLLVRVRIERMTATGTVLAYSLAKKSGNDAYDDAVSSYMAGYKSGMRTLPVPPDDILEQINSRGFTIDFAVKH